MNTTAVGNAFEEKIFEWFSSEIEADRLFIRRDYCRIYRKKGYYSRDRLKDIIFDISIEIWNPGATAYTMVVLIECKRLGKPISVDDVEEFYAKIQQVSPAAVKGIIATTSAFQDAALNFSESKRIGVLRFYGDVDYKWELNRSSVTVAIPGGDWVAVYRGLIRHGNRRGQHTCYCFYPGIYTNSVSDFFQALCHDADLDLRIIAPDEPAPSAVPVVRQVVEHLTSEQIESKCDTILRTIGYTEGKVSLHSICEWQRKESGLTVSYVPRLDGELDSVLGRLRFKPLEITVYSTGNEGRERFTLAHELGHLFLGHSRYMFGEYCDNADVELRQPTIPGREAEDIMRMEWQANYFASCLLLPKQPLKAYLMTLAKRFNLRDRGFGLLFLDNQSCNQTKFLRITDLLMYNFGVSRTALTIRLKSMGIVIDAR